MSMKMISLNTWGGRAGREKLLAFFEQYKDSVDIFCLQEIWSAPYYHLEGSAAGGININHSDIMVFGLQEISQVLNNYSVYFHPHHLENYGLMMLVKKDINVLDVGDIFVHRERGYVPEGDVGNNARNIQFVHIKTARGKRAILNFHGLWTGKGKGDDESRLLQSTRIVKFLNSIDDSIIFCGDFNLLPDTKSLQMIEGFGLRNLIKEYDIKSTRTSFYTREEKFADYTLVSKDIVVKDFRVLPDEVSDHSPMYLEFE